MESFMNKSKESTIKKYYKSTAQISKHYSPEGFVIHE